MNVLLIFRAKVKTQPPKQAPTYCQIASNVRNKSGIGRHGTLSPLFRTFIGEEDTREGTVDEKSMNQREIHLQAISEQFKFQDLDRGVSLVLCNVYKI